MENITCPYCGLINGAETKQCSCGYCFDKELYEQISAQKQIMETKNIPIVWIRLANCIIDYTPIYLIGLLLVIILGITGLSETYRNFYDNTILGKYIISFSLVFIYYFIFETLTGRTLGKYFTRTKVINRDGLKPSYADILG